MKIYLDTWTIQNWSTGNLLDDREKQFLNSLFDSTEHQVILSVIHLSEISARQDKKEAIKIASLLDKLPNKLWIKNPEDLIISEIKQAYNHYKKRPLFNTIPFVNSPVHTLSADENALSIRLDGSNLSIEDLISSFSDPNEENKFRSKFNTIIPNWASDNTTIAQSFSKSSWPNEIQEKLKTTLLEIIIKNQLIPGQDLKTDEFIDFLIANPMLISALYFPFYLQHFLHRNSRKFKLSDIGDLLICSFIDYIDQIILDNKKYQQAKQALNSMLGLQKIKSNFLSKLNKSVNELIGKLEVLRKEKDQKVQF